MKGFDGDDVGHSFDHPTCRLNAPGMARMVMMAVGEQHKHRPGTSADELCENLINSVLLLFRCAGVDDNDLEWRTQNKSVGRDERRFIDKRAQMCIPGTWNRHPFRQASSNRRSSPQATELPNTSRRLVSSAAAAIESIRPPRLSATTPLTISPVMVMRNCSCSQKHLIFTKNENRSTSR